MLFLIYYKKAQFINCTIPVKSSESKFRMEEIWRA